MKRISPCFAIGVILVTIALCAGASSPGPAGDSSEIEQLKKEVETLRQRVESLEKRLTGGPTVVFPHGRTMPPMSIDPNGLLSPRSTPRDWRRFEFNGMPYYVIPIEGAACPQPQSSR